MMDVSGRLLLGLILSLVIGGLAYWRRSLSASGILGAVLLGTTILGWGGWVWGGTLVAFFVSSSLLSHYRERQKSAVAENFAKGGRRDLVQTLANGGLAALLSVVVGFIGKSSPFYPMVAFGFFGAVATANADTWATELGVLAHSTPRLITTRRAVPPGTSGAMTGEGTLAALAGAFVMGLAAFLLVQGASIITTGRWLLSDWVLIPAATLSGFAGCLCDSFLGGTVQAGYFCRQCQVETERRVHRCGEPAQLIRGWRWLDNDWVNFLASLAGAVFGAILGLLFI